ncbi:hypothetical protein TCAL_15551 [Tigriopus californicus]|uniref:Uncharacterized protein n=1 Tax=Tigriopus californicus TaxID=6832 RepID=A0A553PRV9_TIGCA|nr:hypothetical protein TCAL_15551 [Tigriopus californicus]
MKLRIDNARPSVQSILLPNAQQLTIVFVLSIPQSFIALLALAVVVLPITLSSPAPLRPSPYKPEPKYEEGPAHTNMLMPSRTSMPTWTSRPMRSVMVTRPLGPPPDGRTQTVTYTVDGYSGYVADVQYAGEAKYEPYQPKPPPSTLLLPPSKTTGTLASFSFPNKLRIDNARPSVQSILLPNAQQLTIVFVLSIPQSFIALLALAVVVLADNPPPPPPAYKPAPSLQA